MAADSMSGLLLGVAENELFFNCQTMVLDQRKAAEVMFTLRW